MAQTKSNSQTSKSKPKTMIPAGSAELAEPIARRLYSKLSGSATQDIDIIDAIKEDHKPLKDLIKIMKSDDATFAQKKAAFKKFAPTLIAHAKPEEASWYADMKSISKLKVDGHEGDVEHKLSDQLIKEVKLNPSRDLYLAKVKVLAELVEHHIQEEENDMLPAYKKETTSEERYKVGAKYLKARAAYLTH